MKSPFSVDYTNLQEVIVYAKSFGPGHSVVKYPNRPNYNIRHTARDSELPEDVIVVYRT